VRDGRQRVVILYSHPLLGEGLGHLLSTQPDLIVEFVHVDDLAEAEAALRSAPDVVIVERTPPVQAIDVLRLAPTALLIDVGLDPGPSWTYRRDELGSQPDSLLRAIHDRAAWPAGVGSAVPGRAGTRLPRVGLPPVR
jgi:hypothetical protein